MARNVKPLTMPNLDQSFSAKLLGQAIKARRTQSGLRLEDAAALCGVAKDSLMKVEHGHDTAQLNTILQICTGLGVQLHISPWSESAEVSDDWC